MPPTPQKPNTPETREATGTEYRYMGDHATEVQVGDALPWLAPGEFVVLSDEETKGEKIAALIESGHLVEVTKIGEEGQKAEAKAKLDAQADKDEEEGGK